VNKSVIYLILAVILAVGSYFWFSKDGSFVFVPKETETAKPALESPTPSPTLEQGSIRVTLPKANDVVENPITVTGTARVFEQTFNWKLKNRDTGKVLSESFAMSQGEELSEFNPFSFKIPLAVGSPRDLLLQVIEYSAKDGSVAYQVDIPLELKSQETMSLSVFFSQNNPSDCSNVAATSRTVLKTKETGYIALHELLKGPATLEKVKGFRTSIPDNVRINSLNISDGVARADFSPELEVGVAGSCRVTAIRSQITQTLKQFPSVKDVVISIGGRTEDILQP